MSFLNPLFLFGLLAAAIPLIIHLFTRRRPRDVAFPSLEFLSEVNRSEIRRLRVKQWLLLLLRTLAVAAIALAMARPAVRGVLGLHSNAATSVVVLVDQSGSMGASAAVADGSARTLMGDARRVIENLLATLGPEDDVFLVPYDRGARPVTPRPSSDLARVRAAAQALEPSAHTTDHRQALEFGAKAVGDARALNRELFWISDFQNTGFASGASSGGGAGAAGAGASATDGGGLDDATAPAGPWDRTRIYVIPIQTVNLANVAVTAAALSPSEGDVALSVSSGSFGAREGDLAVEVFDASDDMALGRGFLAIPASGEATTLLPLARLPEEGGAVRIPDDALQLDNTRSFAAGRAGMLRVLIREDGPPSALRLAIEAGGEASGLASEAVSGAALAARAREADAIVINDVERLGSVELQAVLDFHRAGGGLFVVLGRRSDAAFWNSSLLREIGAGTLGASEQAGAGGAWRLMRATAGHPVLAGFPARPGEPLSNARFRTVRRFAPGPGTRIVLRYDRDMPALLEAPHAFIFAGSLEPADSDFPVSGAYLPLVHQIAKVLGRGTAAASLVPGDRYTTPAATGTWRIEDHEGREVPSALNAERGPTRLESEPLERPGLYRVLQSGRLRSSFAVNPDPRESDLTARSEAQLIAMFPPGRAQIMRPGAQLTQRIREARFGRELWSWFVILALILLVAEMILARWGMATRAPHAEAAATP